MLGRLVSLLILAWVLVGCAIKEPYQPSTLRHPHTGATVICGHWVWWECLVADFERSGYRRLEASR